MKKILFLLSTVILMMTSKTSAQIYYTTNEFCLVQVTEYMGDDMYFTWCKTPQYNNPYWGIHNGSYFYMRNFSYSRLYRNISLSYNLHMPIHIHHRPVYSHRIIIYHSRPHTTWHTWNSWHWHNPWYWNSPWHWHNPWHTHYHYHFHNNNNNNRRINFTTGNVHYGPRLNTSTTIGTQNRNNTTFQTNPRQQNVVGGGRESTPNRYTPTRTIDEYAKPRINNTPERRGNTQQNIERNDAQRETRVNPQVNSNREDRRTYEGPTREQNINRNEYTSPANRLQDNRRSINQNNRAPQRTNQNTQNNRPQAHPPQQNNRQQPQAQPQQRQQPQAQPQQRQQPQQSGRSTQQSGQSGQSRQGGR